MTQPDDDEDELRDTGHDVHFLERLERLDLVTTDLALRLYRSPELVRALLADPTCPQGAERVAIAIQPGPSPAHVMVARGGAFVTCLGQGMEVSGTPIISWERLRIHLHRAETRAAQRSRADEILQGSDARALLRRITEAGPSLTREEFQQLLAVEPTLQGRFATEVLDMYAAVFRLVGPVARVKRIGAVEERALRTFWRIFHAAGHLLLLSSLGGRRSFTPWDQIAQTHDVDIYDRFYLKLFRFGYGPTALRSVWAMGCAGKLALPSLKRAISTAERLLGWTAPALGLLAIGLRHQRLRTEIEGVIGPARLPPNLRDMATATQLTRFLQMMVRGEFVDPARLSEEQDFSLRNFAATALALRVPPDKMPELSLTEFVDFLREDPLLFTHLANASFTFDRETPGLALLTAGTLALATQPAEQFYYPAEHIHLAPQYTPELVRLLSWFARPAPPVRAQPKAARNEPCPCGSGKKYKKCCGSA